MSQKRFTHKEQKMWQEMADLTLEKCKEHCHDLGSCCNADDCGITEDYAKSQGVTLERIPDSKIPFLRDGKCIVPPHLRPCCSLHQCKISGMGFDAKDPKWTNRYFKLREQLDKLAWKGKKG